MNIQAMISRKIAFALLLAASGGSAYCQNPATPADNRPVVGAKHFFRAPDVMPGTLPEMREASYWISKTQNPDEVVMPLARIQAMNKDFQARMSNPADLDAPLLRLITRKMESSPGYIMAFPDLYAKTPEALSALTKEMVNKGVAYFKKGKYGNALAIEYSDREIAGIEAEMASAQIGSQVKIQPGITVEDIQLRIVPSTDLAMLGLSDRNKNKWDMWNLDMVPIGSAVQILHTSKSGGSVFVLSENGYGWINSDKVALGTKTQTEQFKQLSKFATCTGDKVAFYTDATCKYASGWFRMGDRLPLAGNNPRIVSVPVRQADGKLVMQQAWLAPDADVYAGYLPYTRKNVIVQSLKLQDNIYDWTGAWLGRNHATALRDIFASFGFKLPGYGELMSAFTTNKVDRLPKTTPKDKQYEAVLAHNPFVTLQICSSGHSQLLMGNYNSTPIVYDTHGYSYVDNGREVDVRRSNVGPIEFPDYFLKEDVIFITLK